MSQDVLIVAESDDLHAEAMGEFLRQRHGTRSVILDMADFPRQVGTFRLGRSVYTEFGGMPLDQVGTVWWRRPRAAKVPASTSPADDAYRQAECDSFVQGLLLSLPIRWVNDPRAERAAVRKIVQLRAAQQSGLLVPETIVTNYPEEARAFISSRPGEVICKRIGSTREFAPTRILGPQDDLRLDGIRSAPAIFQDYIHAEADLRIVWIDGQECTVRIDSQAGKGAVDSRLDSSVDFTADTLDPAVSDSLTKLMRTLGLAFGVIDMRLGIDGSCYFLEVNPQGQFTYLEIKTGLPIFELLAQFLTATHGGGSQGY